MSSEKTIQFLAYYLPQYHPIPENDLWWGKDFTEWTNVIKAKPLFKGHEQPIVPGELGYYDLRNSDSQLAQSQLANEYGIDGFIYYQYWFGKGKMLLEKPAEAMILNKEITTSFCFCWANETWKGIWHGLDNPSVLMEQTYNGVDDYTDYFNYLLPFFKEDRYIKVDNKPMFHIYKIDDIPNVNEFIDLFNKLAINSGFNGIYFIATLNVFSENVLNNDKVYGVVGIDTFRKIRYSQIHIFKEGSFLNKIEKKILARLGYYNQVGTRVKPLILNYNKGIKKLHIKFPHKKYIPCVIPNWDNSARSGKKSLILIKSSPKIFYDYMKKTLIEMKKNDDNPPFLIIKSWNEWAEGNYIEPDSKYGREWLEVVKTIKKEFS